MPETSINLDPASSGIMIKKLDGFLTVANQLCQVIKKENAALKEHRFAEISQIQEQKNKSVAAYMEGFKNMAAYKEVLKLMPTEKVEILTKITKSLNALMDSNAKLLRAAVNASNHIVATIVQAVESREQEAKGFYSNTGKAGNGARCRSALSINTVL